MKLEMGINKTADTQINPYYISINAKYYLFHLIIFWGGKISINSSLDSSEGVIVFKIGEWTKKNIKYDLSTLTESVSQKASWVLKNKEGVCDELTNLFISMLRSVGIPARFVTGMVYTNMESSWGNHGWAEVYFPGKGRVPWDVTFGQFGWVDPSHVKLDDDVDSGESSVNYKWRSRNIRRREQDSNCKYKYSIIDFKRKGIFNCSLGFNR